VPSAFPSSVFELSWILSTLLEGGFSKQDLGTDICEKFGAFLETELDRRAGQKRWNFRFRLVYKSLNIISPIMLNNREAPGVMSDADDTARTILILSLLGLKTDC